MDSPEELLEAMTGSAAGSGGMRGVSGKSGGLGISICDSIGPRGDSGLSIGAAPLCGAKGCITGMG